MSSSPSARVLRVPSDNASCLTRPTLIAAAHGTRSEAGTATVRELIDQIRSRRPEVPVVEAWIDVRQPDVPTVLSEHLGAAVVVPLLLSVGYHVRHDLPAAARGRANVAITAPLGPDDLVTTALVARLAEARTGAGLTAQGNAGEPVILVAAGSTDPDASSELDAACALLAARLNRPVVPAVLTAAEPLLHKVIERVGPAADIANYLLAGGFFADRLAVIARDAGIAAVAAPLGAHPALADLVLRRYDVAARELGASPSM
jgi:sirohydrochlorin ferrochelatase